MSDNRPDNIVTHQTFVWDVQASEPYQAGPDGPWRWRDYSNLRLTVLAGTMERAIELFRQHHPAARLHQVVKRNAITDVIVDMDAVIEAKGERG